MISCGESPFQFLLSEENVTRASCPSTMRPFVCGLGLELGLGWCQIILEQHLQTDKSSLIKSWLSTKLHISSTDMAVKASGSYAFKFGSTGMDRDDLQEWNCQVGAVIVSREKQELKIVKYL